MTAKHEGSPRTASMQQQSIRSNVPSETFSFERLNQTALVYLPTILEDYLELETKLVGREIQMINPLRPDHEFGSFSINCETGMWADFAGDDEAKGVSASAG